jgi:hypothetical protein
MKFLLTIGAAALALVGAANAQSVVDKFTVHFSMPIMVSGTTLPAGDSTIQVLRGSSDSVILAIRTESGATACAVVNRLNETDTDTGGHARVILSHRGNDYRLESVLLPDHTGFKVLPTAE